MGTRSSRPHGIRSSDVVFFLDDKSVVIAQFRYSWSRRSSGHVPVFIIRAGVGGYCWSVYHVRNEFYDQYLLGLSILDRLGA